jgi:hypothetical protein
MDRAGTVASSVRRPSVRKASSVPMPATSTASTSDSAGVTRTGPLPTTRARARVLLDDVGAEKRIAYRRGGPRPRAARPRDPDLLDATRAPPRRARREVREPGRDAAVHDRRDPFSAREASSASGSPGEKEMSAIGFPAEMTASSIGSPRRPGSAPTTASASRRRPRSARVGEIGSRIRTPACAFEAARASSRSRRRRDLELRLPGEVARDRGPDEAATETAILFTPPARRAFW